MELKQSPSLSDLKHFLKSLGKPNSYLFYEIDLSSLGINKKVKALRMFQTKKMKLVNSENFDEYIKYQNKLDEVYVRHWMQHIREIMNIVTYNASFFDYSESFSLNEKRKEIIHPKREEILLSLKEFSEIEIPQDINIYDTLYFIVNKAKSIFLSDKGILGDNYVRENCNSLYNSLEKKRFSFSLNKTSFKIEIFDEERFCKHINSYLRHQFAKIKGSENSNVSLSDLGYIVALISISHDEFGFVPVFANVFRGNFLHGNFKYENYFLPIFDPEFMSIVFGNEKFREFFLFNYFEKVLFLLKEEKDDDALFDNLTFVESLDKKVRSSFDDIYKKLIQIGI